MIKDKKLGVFLLVVSLILLLIGFNVKITGQTIGGGNFFSLFKILGISLFFISLLMLASKRTLDAIIIPLGPSYKEDIERTKRALKEYEKKGTKYFVISGEKGKPKLKESQSNIYKELRKYGIKPSQMKIEGKSKNTLENVIYSLKKLKGVKDIGIVSYPKHHERFEYIINKAKKEGIIPGNIRIHKIKTKQTPKEWIYGTLANIKERYRLRKGIKT